MNAQPLPDDYEPQDSDEQALYDMLKAQGLPTPPPPPSMLVPQTDGLIKATGTQITQIKGSQARITFHSNGGHVSTPSVHQFAGGLYGGFGTDTGTGSFGSNTALVTNVTNNSTAINGIYSGPITISGGSVLSVVNHLTKIAPGYEMDIELPDGAKLCVKKDGSYTVEDKDAKITYKAARVRDFNPFMNASDLLGEFIEDLAKLAVVPQDKALQVPIELFINWLVVRAAQADGEPPPPEIAPLASHPALLPAPVSKPVPVHCGHCGRFVSREKAAIGLRFCSGAHADLHLARRHAQSVLVRIPLLPQSVAAGQPLPAGVAEAVPVQEGRARPRERSGPGQEQAGPAAAARARVRGRGPARRVGAARRAARAVHAPGDHAGAGQLPDPGEGEDYPAAGAAGAGQAIPLNG